MSSYLRPESLDEALRALADGSYAIIAGGTDFYPARAGRAIREDVLDVTAISGLRGIEDCGDCYRIGALTTWSDVLRADLPGWFRALRLAAREIGGVQVQNAGTVVGNICNASPAADGAPCLMAMDAAVELVSISGEREVPISGFIAGNRKTVREPGEMVLALRVPKARPRASSVFLKLGARRYLVISIVMAAAILETASDGTVDRIRVAVGSCSETARRLPDLEATLAGRPADAALADCIATDSVAPLTPINDIRGTAAYRKEAALTMVRRAVSELGGQACQSRSP